MEKYDKDLVEFIEEFKAELNNDASDIELPQSLTSKNLMEKYNIKTVPNEEESADKAKVIPLYKRKSLQFLTVAACAAFAILAYTSSNNNGNNIVDHNPATVAEATNSPMRTAEPAETTYTDLRNTALSYYEDIMLDEESGNNKLFDGFFGAMTEGGFGRDDVFVEESVALGATSNDSAPANGAVSSTNTQVAGIDESDIVKTDGEHIYHVRTDYNGNVILSITKAESLELVSDITIPVHTVGELYLVDDKLVMLIPNNIVELESPTLGEIAPIENNDSNLIVPGYMTDESSYSDAVSIYVYDVSNPEKPNLLEDAAQDGYYVSSRLIDDTLYLVTEKNNYNMYSWAEDSTPAIELFPWIKNNNETTIISSNDIMVSPHMNGVSYAIVTSFNIDSGNFNSSAVMGTTDEIMMSEQNLYLASSIYDGKPSTGIVAFSVSPLTGKLSYKGDVMVDGNINDQFSMDEYKGYLRVATTSYESGESSNNLYIYDANLTEVGSVQNLAPEERIYSVRFMGDMAYVVTFKETDPLFAIDVSDPKNPKVLGELKIPGFSDYLHPIGDGKLIGVGQNTYVNTHGGVQIDGIKLSLFDISNPKDPVELDFTIIGNDHSYTEVSYNHKAFMYYPEKSMLGLPADVYTAGNNTEFNGYLLYEIVDDKFNSVGNISSQEGVDSNMRYMYNYNISRGVYIYDDLITVSDGRLQKYNINSLELLDEIIY